MSDVSVEKIEQTPGSTEDQGTPQNITVSSILMLTDLRAFQAARSRAGSVMASSPRKERQPCREGTGHPTPAPAGVLSSCG